MDTKTRHIYAAYKRLPSGLKTYTDCKWGNEKLFHANKLKEGVAILISDKIYFKTKIVIRDKEGHYIMVKGSIQQEDNTIVSIYAPNIVAPKYIKKIWRENKGEIDSNTIIVGG